jgi:hypothetical protein
VSAAAGEHALHTVTAATKVAPGVHGIQVDYFQVSVRLRCRALALIAWCNIMRAGPNEPVGSK